MAASRRPPGYNSDLIAAVRSWAALNTPGHLPDYIQLHYPGMAVPVTLPVLLSLAAPPGDEGAEEAPPDDGPRHSPDYRSAAVAGQSYDFSPAQAAVVKALWEAAENDTPELGQETLLEAAGSDGRRLRDLFRRANGTMHPAWGQLIVPGTARGSFRLALG